MSSLEDNEEKGLDGAENEPIVRLCTLTDVVPILKKATKLSSFLTAALSGDYGEVQDVSLQDVDTLALLKVVEYMTYHMDHPPPPMIVKPLVSVRLIDSGVGQWDSDFLDTLDQDLLFKVISVANFLGIDPLLHLGCAKVASLIKDRSPEQIRSTFDIPNDFTPEEEAKALAEIEWALPRPSPSSVPQD